MKLVSTMTLGLALALTGSALTMQPAWAKKKDAEPAKAAGPVLSNPVRAALAAAQTALAANDTATADAKIAQAQAVATTPTERFYVAQFQLQSALAAKDVAREGVAIDAELASGGAPAELLPKLYQNRGALAYSAKDYAKAEESFGHLVELEPAPENLISYAETQFQMKHVAAGLATSEKAVAAKKASGAAVEEDWYRRPLGQAYQAKMMPEAVRWSQMYVEAYPSSDNWRTALTLFRDYSKLDDQQSLDVYRLQFVANALKGEHDFYDYANTAYERGLPGETKMVVDSATAGKMVDAKSIAINELRTLVANKVAADKASLPALDVRARAAPDAKSALSTANAYLGYGEYAKAADLLRAALQKPGVDADTANTRLGIALAMAGQKAEAAQAFAAVTNGPRGQIARYWTVWLSQKP